MGKQQDSQTGWSWDVDMSCEDKHGSQRNLLRTGMLPAGIRQHAKDHNVDIDL